MIKERRHGERIQPKLRVRTEVVMEKGNIHMAVFADIVNISEVGVRLRSPLKLNSGDRIMIFLPRLDRQLPYVIHGKVVWTKILAKLLFEYGTKFTNIPKGQEVEVHTQLRDIMSSYFDQRAMQL